MELKCVSNVTSYTPVEHASAAAAPPIKL
jgi:hypothetical protein